MKPTGWWTLLTFFFSFMIDLLVSIATKWEAKWMGFAFGFSVSGSIYLLFFNIRKLMWSLMVWWQETLNHRKCCFPTISWYAVFYVVRIQEERMWMHPRRWSKYGDKYCLFSCYLKTSEDTSRKHWESEIPLLTM